MTSLTPADSPRRPSWKTAVRGNVLMVGLVSLFTDFSSEMIYPLLPAFFAGLAESPGQAALWVGIMEAVAEPTASILKIFSGRISDRMGKRKALVALGYGLSTVVRPLMAAAGVAWHVVGLRFFDRVGKGLRTSPRDALISDAVDKEYRGLAFSFHRAMDHTGAILGPVVGVLALWLLLRGQDGLSVLLWSKGAASGTTGPAEMRALRWLFALALVPGLLAMASIARIRELPPATPPRPAPAGATAEKVWTRLPGRFYGFVGIVTLFALGNSSDLFIIYYGFEKFGMGLAQLIGLWVALHVAKMVFSIPGGVLSDRLGRRPVIVAGWVVYAAVYAGFALVGVAAPWHFWALLVAYGLYYGLTEGAEKALVADFSPPDMRGTAFGVYHTAVGLAAMPANLMFALVARALNLPTAFAIGAALAGAAAVLLTVLLSTARKKA